MILVLAMAAAIWGVGHLMGMPRRARWPLIGLLLVAVMALQLTLPDGHPLREATGGSPALWAILAGFAALIWAYSQLLGRLRNRAQESAEAAAPAAQPGTFSASELDRYARHIVLREIGGPGQKRLKQARVLVVGAGGLGAPALLYLGAAGVGTIGIIDDDVVENANLQRQVLHTDARIGMPKVFSAKEAVEAQNPHVTVQPYHRRLTADIAEELIAGYDLILDGCDNFETRYLVNETAARLGKPLISGALAQWEGQLTVFDPKAGTPCYRCIFPEPPAAGLAPSCAEAGVIGPLPGVIGAMMALEAVKEITGAGQTLRGAMMIYDGLWGETRRIALKPRPGCPTCGTPAAQTLREETTDDEPAA